MVTFRNFLFLDESMLDDFLATIMGHITKGSIDQTEYEKKGKGGKAGYKIIEGEIASEKSTETKRTLAVTNAAKFQQLYELMEDDDMFMYLDLFDLETWKKVRRRDIVEAEVSIRLPESFSLTQAVDGIAPFLKLMETLGEDPLSDPSTRVAFEGFSEISKIMEKKPIPLVCESLGTPGYKYACNLPRKFIRCDLENLVGEATLFGKVKRVIPEGSKYDLFSLLSAFDSFLPSMNQSQQGKMKRDMAQQGLAEVVYGPALIISPLAIYQ
jgi:hypothetical protein